jgi:hypothetical protein
MVCVHFVALNLFPKFGSSLMEGGYFLFETFGGQGKNYLGLPKQGEVEHLLRDRFDLLFYRERPVGPDAFKAAAVSLLARKKEPQRS